MDKGEGSRGAARQGAGGSGKPRLGKGLYWRGETIWAKFQVGGRVYRVSCHTRSEKTAAARRDTARQDVISQSVYGERGPVSWSDAVDTWSNNPPASINAKTAVRYAVSLVQLEPWLANKSVQDVTTDLLKEIVAARLKEVGKRTVQRDLTAISSVLEVAEDEGWVEDNIARTFNRKKVREKAHKIVLPVAEHVAAVIADAPARFGDMIDFAHETGCRQEEIASLTHESVDLKRKQATLYFGAKGDKVRTISLSPRAVAIIKRQKPHTGSPYVFWHGKGERYANVSSRFGVIRARVAQKRAQQKLPFRRFKFHDLRHLYAVEYLKGRKGTIYQLQMLLGHESVKTTEMYLNYVTPEDALAAKYDAGTKTGTGITVQPQKTRRKAPARELESAEL